MTFGAGRPCKLEQSLRRTGEELVHSLVNPFLLILYSNVHDPRALAAILQKAEADLANMKHPDPYIREFSWLNSVVGCLVQIRLQHRLLPEVQNGVFSRIHLNINS